MSLTASALSQKVLHFYFKGAFGKSSLDIINAGCMKLWFGADAETDTFIKTEFEPYISSYHTYEEELKSSASSTLALILLLDQFPRNIYRNSPKAFEFDSKALELSLYALDKRFDVQVDPVSRMFFYLPLEHSENIAMQNLCVEKFTAMNPELTPDLKLGDSLVKFAIEHRDLIARFGRFPHRNKALGRANTPEEETFLSAQEGGMFGQGK